MSDVLVIGTGPGGAAAAAELASLGAHVTMLEWGSAAPLRGRLGDMLKIAALPGRSAFFASDGSALFRGLGVGGTTLVNYATAYPPPLDRFKALGLDLAPALAAARRELPLAPLPDTLVGPMAQRIEVAAQALGLPWQRFDKMIDPVRCRAACWRCSYGCPFGAKWSARALVDQACAAGATLRTGCRVRRILSERGQVSGVEYVRAGQVERAQAETVILAAGGIGSPRLLAASGLTFPPTLFVDPVVAVMGRVDGIDGGAEVPMAAGLHRADDGLMLADMTLPKFLFQAFAAQAGHFGKLLAHRQTLSLMVKIPDTPGGRIGRHWVNKPLAPADRELLNRGTALAGEILRAAGATEVFTSRPFAAHPGGTAAIGAVVDSRLETAIRGLFVCDASVLPSPWGLPPTLTLICLAKRLATQLAATSADAGRQARPAINA
jgi:choline dehydrogenase-like flavoprotein